MNKICNSCEKEFDFPVEDYVFLKDINGFEKNYILNFWKNQEVKCKECLYKSEYFENLLVIVEKQKNTIYVCDCGWSGDRPNLRSGIMVCHVCNKRVRLVVNKPNLSLVEKGMFKNKFDFVNHNKISQKTLSIEFDF